MRQQNLNGYRIVRPQIYRMVNLSHPTAGNELADFVATGKDGAGQPGGTVRVLRHHSPHFTGVFWVLAGNLEPGNLALLAALVQNGGVSEEKTTPEVIALVGDWLTIPDIAEMLDLKVTRVHTLISDRSLLAVRDPETNVRKVPALFMRENRVLESLKGTLTVLDDSGFTDEEAIVWLYTEDDSLPGRPIDALINGRKTEIRRRASALAW